MFDKVLMVILSLLGVPKTGAGSELNGVILYDIVFSTLRRLSVSEVITTAG